MISSRKAIVIGGSLGGLFAANMLLRAGWDVHVYERVADELQGRGAGIVTHPELMAALATAGIAVDNDFGIEVRQRITLAQDGSVRGARDMPQKLTAWGHMYHVLRSGIPDARYHNGKQFVSFTQDEASITATFKDGEQVRGDLLLAADGLRSAVRQSLLPSATPAYAGYIAWRGLVEESSLSPRARQELFPYFAFGLPPREQMIAYPVAGKGNAVEPGKRRYNFVWYRPADEATTLRDMMTDASGKTWPDGIPPPLIRPEVLAEARRSADEVLAPQFAEVVHKTESPFLPADLRPGESATRVRSSRVARRRGVRRASPLRHGRDQGRRRRRRAGRRASGQRRHRPPPCASTRRAGSRSAVSS